MIDRRTIMGGLVAGLAAGAASAQALERSPRPKPRPERGKATAPAAVKDASALVAAAELTGTVSYIVMDAATGAVLEQREADRPMPPASVAKAVTALYALDRIGPSRRFSTRILATGPVRGGQVQGDLVLAGGGDPTLQTDQLGDLVGDLAARGIKGATGRLLYWEGALPRLARVAEDQPPQVGYNPAISGLNLNFNRVHFEWKRAGGDWQLGMDARGERFVPKVGMVGMKIAQRESPLFTYAQGDAREDWTVASSALGKGGSRWLPVRLPGLYLAEVFRTLARARGIDLPAPRAIDRLLQGEEIARADSRPLPEVLREMLRWSTNITAECCGLSASGATGLSGSGRAMSAWVQQTYGVKPDLVDHSGLGGASRIRAADMAQILLRAHRGGAGLRAILRDVGMKDDKGKVIKDHKVKVLAKTGTLNFVSALAGHIVPPGGREMIFAIFTGDPARRDAVPVAQRENPAGAEAWNARSRRLQGQLVSRWATLHA